jgi:hypothetical protein
VIAKLLNIIEHGLGRTVKLNWKNTINYNPKFGPNPGDGGKGGINIPAYGEYGGPQTSGPDDPVDALDTLFKAHDLAIGEAMKDGKLLPAELVIPHAALINGIVGLEETQDGLLVVEETAGTSPAGDAEATIYAGMTIFALTAELAQAGLLYQLETALDPSDPVEFDDVPRVLHDAQEYMEKGLKEAPAAGKGLNGALQLFEKEFAEILGTPDTSLSSGSSDYFF